MVSDKAVRQAIYTALNVASVTTNLANGSASLHHSVAPSSAAYPLVIFQQMSDTVIGAFGGDHIDNQVWLVKAIVKGGSSSTAEDIAKAVHDVLHFQDLSIAGADHMYLARETGVSYSEVVSGEVFRHHGHNYRLVHQDT